MTVMAELPWGRSLTVADLDLMPDDGHRYELIDGVLLVSPAPSTLHQHLVLRLARILEDDCPADLKVFLTASEEERARRRQRDDGAPDVHAVAADLARRDTLDSKRAASPLRPADDAVVIDTTARTVEDVVDEVVELLP